MQGTPVETQGLTKDYGHERGLFDLDLTLAPQQVFGYLGPNGAGKSTTIRLLMGLIHPTRGSAKVFGLDCQRDAVAVKRQVGYLPGELPQFGGFRGDEVVEYIGGLRGSFDRNYADRLAERFDLDLTRHFREYSRGNKQKLGLVLAFMHRPSLLLLDEPTSGLDPLNQQEFYRLVREAVAEGATVFLSSHVLSEVEHVCHSVGIIRDGRLVKVAEMDELHELRVHHVEIQFADGVPTEALERLEVEGLSVTGARASFSVRGSFEPLLAALSGARVVDFVSHEPSLEDVLLSYYGQGGQDQTLDQ